MRRSRSPPWWGGPLGSGNVARYNCVINRKLGNISTSDGGFTSTGNQVADPEYLDRTNHDYRMGTDSPCLQLVGYDTAAKLSGGSSSSTVQPSDTTLPSVSWVAPTSGQTVSGVLSEAAGNCKVSAADNVGVAQVGVLPRRRRAQCGQLRSLRLQLGPAQHVERQPHADREGHRRRPGNSASSAVTVNVSNSVFVDAAPSVSLVSPTDGSSVRWKYFSASANASDHVGVAKVEFYIDGSLRATDTSGTYSAGLSVSREAGRALAQRDGQGVRQRRPRHLGQQLVYVTT